MGLSPTSIKGFQVQYNFCHFKSLCTDPIQINVDWLTNVFSVAVD